MPLPCKVQHRSSMGKALGLLALDRSPLVRKLQRRQAGQAFRVRSLAEVEFFVENLNALEQ